MSNEEDFRFRQQFTQVRIDFWTIFRLFKLTVTQGKSIGGKQYGTEFSGKSN